MKNLITTIILTPLLMASLHITTFAVDIPNKNTVIENVSQYYTQDLTSITEQEIADCIANADIGTPRTVFITSKEIADIKTAYNVSNINTSYLGRIKYPGKTRTLEAYSAVFTRFNRQSVHQSWGESWLITCKAIVGIMANNPDCFDDNQRLGIALVLSDTLKRNPEAFTSKEHPETSGISFVAQLISDINTATGDNIKRAIIATLL